MGAFDDAIREHLELKRRQGASEEDIKQQEEEALGRGAVRFARPETTAEPLGGEQTATPRADDAAPEPPKPPEETPEAARAAVAESDEVVLEAREQPAEPGPEAQERPVPPTPEVHEQPPPPPDLDQLEPNEVLPDEALEPSVEEDLLEETPDFLEESPDQDRLWFEQRAPKDFDFGD